MIPSHTPAEKGLALRNLPVSAYIFLGVFVLRLVVLVRLTDSQFLLPTTGDMQFYNSWALRILRGEWTNHAAFYGLPLYAYLLAAFYKIGGYSPFIPGLLQAGLEGGTAVLLYKLGSCAFGAEAAVVAGGADPGDLKAQDIGDRGQRPRLQGKAIGLLAAIGWAFFQPAEAYSVILMPTSWLVFVFWFVVWQIVKRKRGPGLGQLFFLGGVIGFTAMGIATVLFLIPLLAAAVFLRWPQPPARRCIGVVLIVAGVFLGTAPAWMHNYLVAHDPVFLSAHSGVNFWIGNNPIAAGYPNFPPGLHAGQEAMLKDSITTAEKAAGKPLKRSEVSAYWSGKARAWIEQNPDAWVRLLGIKIKNFWNAFQYDDLSIVTALRDQMIIFPGISFGLVAALGLPGLLLACWKYPGARWIAGAVLLYMASLLTVFVTERYRLAAVPGLLLFAAFGIWELWRNLATKRLGAVALFLVLVCGATAFVSTPQEDPTLWALDTYNSGLQALEADNLSLARQKLDRAHAYSPLNAEINFAEGNLHLALGETNRAKGFYLSTLRLDPEHAGAYNNLGVLALREERWSLAEQFFSRELEQGPEDSKAHYLLAQARFGAGDISGAKLEIRQAIRFNPKQPEFLRFRDELEKE